MRIMADTIKPFDAAEYLRDEEDIAEYLNAAAEDGDPATMAQALGVVARAQGMAQLARDTGITREGLYKALSPGGNPSFATVAKVAEALGFSMAFTVKATTSQGGAREAKTVRTPVLAAKRKRAIG